MAAEALVSSDKLGTWLMIAASAACIALGALGGVIAMGAANGPREVYDAAVARLDAAQGRLNEAQSRLDSVPTCTPDMPRLRCIAQTEQNAATLADRSLTRDEAKQERDAARAQVHALRNPGPGMPAVPLWQKALVIAAVEFVLFAVPFAARRRRLREANKASITLQSDAVPMAQPSKAKPKINDGGGRVDGSCTGRLGASVAVRACQRSLVSRSSAAEYASITEDGDCISTSGIELLACVICFTQQNGGLRVHRGVSIGPTVSKAVWGHCNGVAVQRKEFDSFSEGGGRFRQLRRADQE